MSQKRIRKLKKLATNAVESEKSNIFKTHSVIQILKDNWRFMLLISVGILALYFNGLKGDFVSDDYATLINNSNIHSLKYFSKDNFSPVVIFNFLIANIFGVVPVAFHVTSVLVYILTCWLAIIFLNFITTKEISRITMLIFALMPIHVEAVTWISGRPYLFIAFFVLFSAVTFFKYLESNKLIYFWLAAMSFLLGIMVDTPRPFSIFFVSGLYLMMNNNKVFWQRSKRLILYTLIMLVIVFAFKFSNITGRINVVNSGYNQSESIFYNPLFQYPTGIPKYLQLMFFPVDLTLYHTMYVFPLWLNWMILLSFLSVLVYSFFRFKIIFFALMFFLITLLPSMAPIKVSWLVAERYGYLPSLGIALFMGILVVNLQKFNKYLSIFLVSSFCLFFLVKVLARNIDWTTNHKLWVNTCQVSPNSHNAWNNIGDDYDKLKDYESAVKGFTQSVFVKPNYADAYHNRANILFKIGRLDLARESYNTALIFSPSLYQTYLSLTQIDITEKRGDLAFMHAQKAVELQPQDPQSLYVLGVVNAQFGQPDEAIKIFESILAVYPTYEPVVNALREIKTMLSKT